MRENIQKIEIDYNKSIIKCGNIFNITSYIPNIDWRYVSSACGYPVSNRGKKKCGTKHNNLAVSNTLGMPPKRYAKILRGKQHELWIKGKEEFISKLCIRRKKISSGRLVYLNRNINLLKQYRQDGLDNLLPLALVTGKTTRELKNSLGKSVWKKYCKNSFSRNKLISDMLYNNSGHGYKLLTLAISIPSSIFKYNRIDYIDDSILWRINVLKQNRKLTMKNGLKELENLYYDTERMARQLSTSFNKEWSYRTMKEKHDQFSKEITLKNHPDKYIDCLDNIGLKEYRAYGLVATLLDTPYKISLQGKKERHCVGSYINSVKSGSYLVYDISKNGETLSTLGVNINRIEIDKGFRNVYSFSQHYMKQNSSIDNYKDKDYNFNVLKKISEDIIKELNGQQHN